MAIFLRRFKHLLTSLGFGGAFALGIILVLLLMSSFERGRQAIFNPFGFSTKITPSGPVVLEQIQKMARLETCRYTGHTVVKGDTTGALPTFIAGDRLLFVGHGEAVAGVDFGKMQEGDIIVEGDRVSIKLPPAELFHTRLDSQQSEVVERQTGVFSRPDPQLETKVRQEAENRIREAAMQSKILENAGANARETLRKQMAALGFTKIEIQ